MSEIGQSDELLSKELYFFCKSDLLSEEGLRQIFERHGLKPNNHSLMSNHKKIFRAACRNERITEGMIQCLLEYFPAASAIGEGWTPLHVVCMSKSATLNIIKLLIDAAPETVRSLSKKGSTPLHKLCKNTEVNEATAIQILQWLIEKYPEALQHAENDGGWLPIHIASWSKKSPEFFRVLVEANPGSERTPDASGLLPLHWACYNNSLATVEYLYKLYPDAILHESAGGCYPIQFAIVGTIYFPDIPRDIPAAAVEIVQFLLDCEPNVKLQMNSRGGDLLLYACERDYNDSSMHAALEVIKLIYDTLPEAIEDDDFASSIHQFHQQVQAFIIKELVYARQAKDHRLMTTPDDHGRLPLHTALQNNATLGSIKLLVQGNPHAVHSPDNSGSLPLHIACQHHDSASVVQYLVELDTILGLDATSLGAVDQEGDAALHYACRGAKYDTIALLLEKYDAVSVSMRNAQNKLPIELLWESNAVEGREGVEYTDSIFRLLKAYPETLRDVDTDDVKPASAARSGRSGNGKKSCRNSLLVFIRKAMRSSRKRVQNIMRKPASASDGLP